MIGNIISIIIEINCQIVHQEKIESKNIINIGKKNSAEDKPNQIPLSAFPLLLLKYREIVVDEVCDIKPCPEYLITNIAIIGK